MSQERITEIQELLDSKVFHHSSKESKALKAELGQLQSEAASGPAKVVTEDDFEIVEAVITEGPTGLSGGPGSVGIEHSKGSELPKESKAKEKVKEVVKALQETSDEMEIDPDKTYVFQFENGLEVPGRTIPRQAQVWDEKENTLRTIRYCKRESSPYADEQSDTASIDDRDIRFDHGTLRVSGRDQSLIRYLLAYDGNAEKDKKHLIFENRRDHGLYTLIREDKSVASSRKVREARQEAGQLVLEATKEELENFLRSRFNFNTSQVQVDNKEDVLYDKALELVQDSPEVFLEDFKNPQHKYRAVVQKGFEAGLLKHSAGVVSWADTSGEVLRHGTGVRSDEALAKHILATQEGKEFYAQLTDKLAGV